ncbi:unnamed protein product [Owenia fusiformis]|uniref:Uncharacterized protein n=1 Tax=Owenia fusiformis TaxID=6347 RepID=A0A8S4Q3V0_OWEFU|nr:unnamed protein product [Owenia fusiformis]
MAFVGKWELSASDNLDAYLTALGVPAGKQADIKAALEPPAKSTEEYSLSGDSLTVKTVTTAGDETHTYQLGAPTDDNILTWAAAKVVFEAKGNTLIETQKGDFGEAVVEATATGNTLTVKLTSKGVTATRTYTKV